MNKKILFAVATISAMFSLASVELKIQYDLEKIDSKSYLPNGWYLNSSGSYKPVPKIEYSVENGKKSMYIHDINGSGGMALCHSATFEAEAGDKIVATAMVKGKGTGWFELQGFCGATWMGYCGKVPFARFPISSEWKEVKIPMTVLNLSPVKTTDKVMFSFGATKDSELSVRDIKLERIKDSTYTGDLAFPAQWTAFLPMKKDFTPSQTELDRIPATLDGVPGHAMLMEDNEFNFLKDFGGQKVGNCAWLFTTLDAKEAGECTLGLGADWWMEVFLNGERVYDTLKTGNIKHPVRITDHVFNVKLKKGANILAVKYITGGGSSKIAAGGPNNLRDIGKKIRLTAELCKDDYENDQVKREGNPTLMDGKVSWGLITPTKQAVYRAENEIRFTLPKNTFTLPKAATGNFLAIGLRLVSFGREQRSDSRFTITLKEKNGPGKCTVELTYIGNVPEILGTVYDNGKANNHFRIPYGKIPADLLFAVSANGNYNLVITSLVDSSLQAVRGDLRFAKDLGDKPFEFNCSFKPTNKSTAEIVIDNLLAGYAAYEHPTAMIPMKIDVQPAFDPIKEGWNLVFDDDFNGNQIDEKKWFFESAELPNLRLKDGFLEISTSLDKRTNRVTSGGLRTRDSFQYGYFEARVRFTRKPGWTANFYLYGGQTGNPFLDGIEVDIFEDYYMGGKNPMSTDKRNLLDHNFHAFVSTVLKSANYITEIPGSPDDFYTIACKWTPFEITYYMNGKAMAATANHSPHNTVTFDALHHQCGTAPVHAIVGAGGVSAKQPIDEIYKVDYVRIYAYPTDKDPSLKLVSPEPPMSVKKGEKFVLEAVASPSAKTKSPIQGAYLMVNGNLLDYKEKPPFKFNVSISEEYYKGSNYFRTGRAGIKPPLDGQLHAFVIFVQDSEGRVAHTEPVIKLSVIPDEEKSTPYQGKPQEIPGRVKCAFYDEGGNGVAYADDNVNAQKQGGFRVNEGVDTNGFVIGNVLTGEWIRITVNVQKTGKYKATLFHGSPPNYDNGRMLLLLDGKYLDTFKLKTNPNGGWGTSQQAVLTGLDLPAGRHVIKLVPIGGFNYSDVLFELETP